MIQDASQRGLRYLHDGDLDKAEDTFRNLLRNDDRSARGWLLLGLVRQARGAWEEALAHYREAARLDPGYADPYNNMGWVYHQLGRPAEAIASLRRALSLRPHFPEAYKNLGNAYLSQGKDGEALACFQKAVRLHPAFPEALNNIARILIPRGQVEEALTLLDRALALTPDSGDALVNLSWAYLVKGEWHKSLASARQAVQLCPEQPAAHNNLGNALLNLGHAEAALGPLRTALRLRPDFSSALENLGLALIRLRRLDEAIVSLERAVQLDPSRAGLWNNLAFARTEQGCWAEAVRDALTALRLQPDLAEAQNNLGLAYLHLRQQDKALPALEQAVRLRPAYPEALVNLGWALIENGQCQRAILVLQEALRLRPLLAAARNNLGLAYSHLGLHDEARENYEAALRLRPDFAEALGGLGIVYKDLGRLAEALACYRKSLTINPRQLVTFSNLLFSLHYAPNVSAEEVFQEHLNWARHHAVLSVPAQPHANDPRPDRRLRVGYVSADFRAHVLGWYTELVVEAHDRQSVEVFCYSNNNRSDDTTQRIRDRADHWRPVFDLCDDEVERMVRRDQIDLLVDLSNHTGGNRQTLFARKPAPVQVTHHGLQYSTANPAIDYRITDEATDPPGATECFHTEELVRLAEVSWCYRPNLVVDVSALPALSSGHLTFGFLGNFSKITLASLTAWSRILHRFPGSRFVVLAKVSPQADRRLLDKFAAQGIDPGRVTLVGRGSRRYYLELYRQIDVALDSFPFTGRMTTADALWMGVPVVMLTGRAGMSRQGASVLSLLGLRHLVTNTSPEYVEAAVRLAGDVARLAELRSDLRERMSRSVFMDPWRFVCRLEEAYRWMWRRWCARRL